MPTHLFVAPSTQSFGEVVLGLRLANELARRGDKIVFLAPAANEVLFRGTDIVFAPIDPLLPTLSRALPEQIANYACDSVVLVDLMVMVLALTSRRIPVETLDALAVPVFAIDIWDLRRAPLQLDLGAGELPLPEAVRSIVPRRLVPVPFSALDAAGAYDALAAPESISADDRARTRATFGIGDEDRLVVFPTSRFQIAAATPAQKRVLATVPRHIVELCLQTGSQTHVLHVGPEPMAGLDARYHFQTQLSGPDYERVLGAADLMVSMNQSATSISTALALGVPALVAISNVARDTSPIVPFPFRVFPFGFVSFLSALVDSTPFARAVPTAELVPGDAFVESARSLLYDPDARTATLSHIRAYVDQIRQLPSPATRFDSLR